MPDILDGTSISLCLTGDLGHPMFTEPTRWGTFQITSRAQMAMLPRLKSPRAIAAGTTPHLISETEPPVGYNYS